MADDSENSVTVEGSNRINDRSTVSKLVTRLRDWLYPNAERIDILISTTDEIAQSVATLTEHMAETDSDALSEVLSRCNEGLEWVLEKYDYPQRPKIIVVNFKSHASQKTRKGYSQDHDLIFVDIESLNSWTGAPLDKPFPIIQNEIDDLKLTISQMVGTFMVEEGTHYLAAHGVKGLTPLPELSTDTGGFVSHYKQPHERDGLINQTEFLLEKYGENPLAPLLSAVELND